MKDFIAADRGWEKGDAFMFTSDYPHYVFNKYDLLTLDYDDQTTCPRYKRTSDGIEGYAYNDDVTPVAAPWGDREMVIDEMERVVITAGVKPNTRSLVKMILGGLYDAGYRRVV